MEGSSCSRQASEGCQSPTEKAHVTERHECLQMGNQQVQTEAGNTAGQNQWDSLGS